MRRGVVLMPGNRLSASSRWSLFRPWASRRANAMIEATIVLPLFLLLCIGILEAGRAWMDYNLLTHAVREGARLAVVTPSLQINDAKVLNRIKNVLQQGGLSLKNGNVVYIQPLRTGQLINVSGTVDFSPVTLFWWPVGPSPTIPLTSMVITRYEV